MGPNKHPFINKSQNRKNTMNTLKKMLDALGVTMKELRSGKRERRLSDARSMIAAALPITQCQIAELLGCTQAAVSFMKKRHKQLLSIDANYRAKWEQIFNH